MKIRTIACAAALSIMALPALAQQTQGQGQAQVQANQPAAQQQTHQARPKSQAEVDALKKVQAAYSAQNWDAAIQAIDSVLESFPDTEFKPQLLDMAANAAASKGDYAQTITYGERAAAADPQNVSIVVLLAEDIAQHTHDTDFDKDQSIKKVNDYANKALELLKNPSTPPPPGLPAEQWPEMKKQDTGQAYDALGQAAGLQKNYAQEIANYKTSLGIYANPVTMARLAKGYVDNKQYDDAISEANQVIAMNNIPAQVKEFAQVQRALATKAKGATPTGAKGPTPPAPAPAK
jgi:tetratricopeptide (TPR) repeat protein